MIEHVYRVGYLTREKERDYDPMGNDMVCEALEKWHRFQLLAKAVADGNFNQAKIIKEARELST